MKQQHTQPDSTPSPEYRELAALVMLAAFASFLLFGAVVARLPYGYYIFLRILVCGLAGYLALRLYERSRVLTSIIAGLTALLYNPVIPVHLSRDIWQPINVTTIGIFAAALYVFHRDIKRT